MIDKRITELLSSLKKSPYDEETDHLLILNDLYWEYRNGLDLLEPIVTFYLNGYDDLPTLEEKKIWNEKKYFEAVTVFNENHNVLIEIINKVLITIDNTDPR